MKSRSWEEAVAWLVAQPDHEALVRESYLDPPLSSAVGRYSESPEWNAVATILPARKGEALDVGAGNGIMSYALARGNWRVTAVEPEGSRTVGAGAIRKLAEEQDLTINTVRGYGELLPFAERTFDLVVARQVLHHARDLGRMCREIHRVLKCGGMFVAAREHVISNRGQLGSFLENHPLHGIFEGENAYLLREYKKALKEAGFVISRVMRPLVSVINYAPLTDQSLREAFFRRASKYLGERMASVVFHSRFFGYEMDLLSLFDRRPGRLYTFVCHRPER